MKRQEAGADLNSRSLIALGQPRRFASEELPRRFVVRDAGVVMTKRPGPPCSKSAESRRLGIETKRSPGARALPFA